MSGRILAIALNTFREAIRNRILYLLLVFAVALILCAQALSLLTVGSEEKIIKDFGLATIDLFGVLTAVLLGIGLVSREIERRTVYVLLAKPIHRAEFVLGKYAGLVLTLLVNTAIMTLCFELLLVLKGIAEPAMLLAVLLLFFQFLLITAIAVLFSCLSNPIVSCILTLALYVTGHLLWSFDLLRARVAAPWARTLCLALQRVLPDLAPFDVKGMVVHGVPIPPERLAYAFVYLVLYGGAVLGLACAAFQRKEMQ
ncbi:MAG TPA: ABC transporter permease [Candidatus Polarisedimenticolia bacterium]|jgi:ABC-type transport system involved in multi-copper enzyme maturation permease subunit|nr:ABC transporter permease [Candidatus Polarisedimenticolia bacterium]